MSTAADQNPTVLPDLLVDRAIRLFSFLGQAQQLKNPRTVDVDSYKRDGGVLWLHDAPDHDAVHLDLQSGTPDPSAPVLVVDRVHRLDPPEPGPELTAWIDGPLNDARRKPVLVEERVLPAPEAGSDDPAGEPTLRRTTPDDHPHVRGAFDGFLRQWQVWADRDLQDEPARTYYSALFSTFVTANGHPEELELVLGTGLLAWRPHEQPAVRRHLLVTPLKVLFDESTGRLTVAADDTTDRTRVELEMLDPSLVGEPQRVNAVRTEAADAFVHPLDRDQAGDLSRRLAHLLSPDGEYRDEDVPAAPTDRPVASFAPAIILRKRSQQGLVEIFRRIVDQIRNSAIVPDGIRPLIDPDHTPDAGGGVVSERSDGALIELDGEPFLPLPVNDMQLRILRQVDSHAQTLIQGPPGTGKTHTAAVLISHLLAQGKRVLVTAHTDRALREVRDKLPAPIRPLAVSVVGASREDMSDLRVAVERIAAAAGDYDADEIRRRVEAQVAAVGELRRRRAAARHRLLEAREREIRVHDLPGYRGTLADVARQRERDRDRHGWIDTFSSELTETPPVSDAEVVLWRALARDADLVTDEPSATRRLVELDRLPTPERFAALTGDEARSAAAAAAHHALRTHSAYRSVDRLGEQDRRALAQHLQLLQAESHALHRRRERWVHEALDDVLHGRHQLWTSRRAALAQLVEQARPIVAKLGPVTDVQVSGDAAALVTPARTLVEHLHSGNGVKLGADGSPRIGAFTARAVKNATAFFDQVRVDGAVPTSTAQVNAFLLWVEGSRLLVALDRAWPASTVIPDEDTLGERLQWHATELGLLDRILAFSAAVQQENHNMARAGLPSPHWDDEQALTDFAMLPSAVTSAIAAAEARRPLDELVQLLADLERRDDVDAVVGALAAAVRDRDHDAYAAGHARLVRLHGLRPRLRQRDHLTAQMSAAAPALAAAVLADPDDPAWDVRLATLADAWAWAASGAWIAAQESIDVNAVQNEVKRTEDQLREHVQELAAVRAWAHAVEPSRLTRRSRSSLEQYATLVRRFGKGTGQYREQRRAEIRDAMDRCRPAVPVWIMPIYRIADQLRVEPGMFDVVIVDEASQAGLEAAFLQYLAPRIVVIGDDKQVSPSAVGVDRQQLRDLGHQYLHDMESRPVWQDPQISMFDAARIWFTGMLTLTEHRRCVPEIIGFSNRIAYEPDNVRLVPVRQFGADRLEPIRTVFVKDGYEHGSSVSKVNPPEVDAIVDQVEKCLADPAYDGMTFGVISLLGTGQARAIEKKLLERVTPDEWTARDLRCGDAADFQGSERDVVFLSMVAAPSEDRRITALTQTTYIQRYNVAASRARDQMWVFHSIDPASLSNREDMRFQLLDYCYGVQRRSQAADHGVLATALPEDRIVEPFDSLFEQRVANRLIDRGYSVVPQFPALGYRIDLVATGAKTRLAVECDGDHWHGPDAYQRDMGRQRELERCGWHFFRLLESEFYLDQAGALAPLWERLAELEIHPSGWVAPEKPADEAQAEPEPTIPVEAAWEPRTEAEFEQEPALDHPVLTELMVDPGAAAADSVVPVQVATTAARSSEPYRSFTGTVAPVAGASRKELMDGLVEIVAVEGPILGSRLHGVYVRASAGQKVGSVIGKTLNSAVTAAVRAGRLIEDDPLGEAGVKPRTYRVAGQPSALVRELGPRSFDQVPPAELAAVMDRIAEECGWDDRGDVYRRTIAQYGLRVLRTPTRARLENIADRLCRPTDDL